VDGLQVEFQEFYYSTSDKMSDEVSDKMCDLTPFKILCEIVR
jgi:hypothetical protein